MYAERLLPHDIDAEESVVGSLLLDGDALWRVAHAVKPEDFYRERNRLVYEAVLEVAQRGEGVNQVTVAHELSRLDKLTEVGGMAYLSHLVAIVPSPVHIEYYAQLVSLTATQRRLIDSAADIAEIGYKGDTDPEALLGQAERSLQRLRASAPSKGRPRSLRDILDEHLVHSEDAVGLPMRGVQTGFDELDAVLVGLQPSDLIVLAARPSLGKTALALNIGVRAAKAGWRVLIFSMEMSAESISQRMLAAEAGVDTHRLTRNMLTAVQERAVLEANGMLSDLLCHVDATSIMTVEELRSKAMRHHLETGVAAAARPTRRRQPRAGDGGDIPRPQGSSAGSERASLGHIPTLAGRGGTGRSQAPPVRPPGKRQHRARCGCGHVPAPRRYLLQHRRMGTPIPRPRVSAEHG